MPGGRECAALLSYPYDDTIIIYMIWRNFVPRTAGGTGRLRKKEMVCMKHKGIKAALIGAGALAAGAGAVAAAGFHTAVVRRDLTPEQEERHLESGSWREDKEE